MNVLLISQCTKRALTETRRILDQFAERRGDRTWQTPITQQGLDTLRQLLKKTARRNTAVACHWIRGQDHSELMWLVGDASQFNALGAVPTNTTSRDILRQTDENDWHTGEDIRLLSAMAALFHDFGKASVLFQRKLEGNARQADPYRHEWVSLRLFQAFVGTDDDRTWLTRLADITKTPDLQWQRRLHRDGLDAGNGNTAPLGKLPPLARAVGWLVVSHHRLPALPSKQPFRAGLLENVFDVVDANWCGASLPSDAASLKSCWTFKQHLPDASAAWRKRAAKLAQRMLARVGLIGRDWLVDNPYVMHIARMGLMLADHHYSRGPAQPTLGDPSYGAFANTGPDGALKQRLDEHLIGVEKNAHGIIHSLPRLEAALPHIARHKGFKKRSSIERFRWQDMAFDLATSLQPRAAKQGFFGVNMASTGCGKTLANGRIMYGLADSLRGARFTVALGLRTLTLQTGNAFRSRLGLGPDDLAVLVGGRPIRQLYEHHEAQRSKLAATGSESAEALLPDNTHVNFESAVEPGPLGEWLADTKGRGGSVQKLLNAPVLVCTVDHLMPACESTRGGHQIAPMLRLMTSDLVLDEPDDFGPEDLYALTRLVHWAGLLGSRILLSSATLPPALLHGLFAAYLAGRRIYQHNRGVPGLPLNVCCAWFDENRVVDSAHADEATFAVAHGAFVQKRLSYLRTIQSNDLRRRARMVELKTPSAQAEVVRPAVAALLLREAQALHSDEQNHSIDPATGKRVSFGLIRMANIDRLIDVARALFQLAALPGTRVHVCVYHSRHPLLVRSAIEQRLDRLLQRAKPEAVFKDVELRALLGASPDTDHLFIVLASPVAEVGRDHDYDWAVVEPSSMRSIIQLAGRIRRHRVSQVVRPNITLLDTNLRALEQPTGAAFQRPGFESQDFPLASHSLGKLLRPEEADVIDAAPRITQRQPLNPPNSLVDLEHERLAAMMLEGADAQRVDPVRRWWQTLSHYTAIEQARTRFRRDDEGREQFALLPNDEGDDFRFCLVGEDGQPVDQTQSRLKTLAQVTSTSIVPWGTTNYIEELTALAETMARKLEDCAREFGTIDLPKNGNEQGWQYHPLLGFRRLPTRQ